MLLKVTLSSEVKSIFGNPDKPRPPMKAGTSFHLAGVEGTVIMATDEPHTYIIDFWGMARPQAQSYLRDWMIMVRDKLGGSRVYGIVIADNKLRVDFVPVNLVE